MTPRHQTLLALALLGPATLAWTLPQDAKQLSDRAQIRRVVRDSYIRVVYRGGELELLRKGLHPSFRMLVLHDDAVETRDLDTWIDRLQRRRKQRGSSTTESKRANDSFEFPMIDVAGPAAVAKLLVRRDGNLRYTDYLTLYRFDEGWRITTKTFAQH